MSRPEHDPAAALSTGPLPPDTAVAVSPHHLASAAALEVMAAGGSAADGAVAADAVLGVVLPDTCGPGGDLFALLHAPGDAAPRALNASGRAGSGVTAADLRARGLDTIPMRSPWSITVPGCVDGWEALLTEAGRLTLAEVLAPALALAEDGFPASAELAASLHRTANLLGARDSAAPLLPDGRPPAPGTLLHRPLLARTLRELAGGGRDAFYLGAVGEGIVAASEGSIRREDLAVRQAEWVEPIGVDVFGRRVWTIPPNSQGYLTAAALWIFAELDPPADPTDPAYHHALVEAYRSVAWERDDLVADPGTAPLPPERLLDPERLRPRAVAVDPTRAGRWPAPSPAPGGTAYLCVRDGAGLGVSLIQSNFWGIGSGRSAGATGVWLQNRGAGFTLRPGHPNELLPGRRPLHTLSPTLWTENGRLALLLGTRGGHYQPQLLAQVAAHLHHARLDASTAQALPRWVLDELGPGVPSRLDYEDRLPDRVVAGLAATGHELTAAGPWQPGWGPVALIGIDDTVTGAADPRVSTAAALAAAGAAGPPR